MKKHHPSPSANPEALYAKVNKPTRGNQRGPTPEEEVLYASVSTSSPLSRDRHHAQRSEDPETDYTTVASPRHETDVLYASVSSVSPLSRGRHPDRGRESPETDYTTVAPHQRGRSSSSLTTEQISVMLLKNPHVQAHAEEIMHWGKIVYGNDKLFQEHLQGILTDPSKGKELSDRLAENPESMHKLAGHSALGIKSQARKAAEDGFKPLIDAIDGYTKAVQDAKTRLSQTPMAEQRRRQENSQQVERHHHHRHHHARGQEQNSPEHSPQRQRHGEKGMAYAM
ncbi:MULTISPECIES: BID domain-containing T4SS effector [unclassified Bartonella]|uniref:BID domain-containing T4SS effector n=1 Tax=unclassified Bartonella TaxID=2645622 RepID=UPI0035D0697C